MHLVDLLRISDFFPLRTYRKFVLESSRKTTEHTRLGINV